MRLFIQILLVSFGSAIGGLARWGVGVGFARWLGEAFPWGTLFINISGSLFLGWFATILAERLALPATGWLQADDLRLMIAVGFTGSYTTFSTFEYESNKLITAGDTWAGTAYIATSVVLGLIAVRLGVGLAKMR